MSRKFFIIFALLLAILLVACGGSDSGEDAEDFKLAAIFPGTITDADYNTLGHLGVTAVQDELGAETVFSESVAVPDVDRVMREYIDDGANIIFTHGGQFLNQTMELAREFPDLFFIAEADAEIADAPDNVWVIVRNMEIGAYGAGALAAEMSETGRVGYITGLTLPFTYAEFHAIEQAIDDQGLTAEVIPVWVGDFNDPSKARELTDALINSDVDVIISSLNLGTVGVMEAVKSADTAIRVITKYTDKSEISPEHYVSSMLYDFAGPLIDIVSSIQDGESGGMYNLGFDTGIGLHLPLQNASGELNEKIEALLADMEAGEVAVIKNTEAVEADIE